MERPKNPNEALIREIIKEDLPLFRMLAANGKTKSHGKVAVPVFHRFLD
jgi:hypothetical protein